MRLKNDKKFEMELTFGFKIDMRIDMTRALESLKYFR